jgi:tetratricopeptide (TPR) repeat protein
MHGPLNEIGLVEVLQLLERGRRSGVLRVVGPDPAAERTLRLLHGKVVALEPDAGDAAIDAALEARHLALTDPALPELGAAAMPTSLREDLRGRLAVRALDAMLHWSRGRFDFGEQVVAPGPLNLATDSLVMQVVDAETRRVELAAEFDGFQVVPGFAAPDVIASGPPVALAPIDWRVLDAVDGVRSVAALAAALAEPIEDVADRVRALVAAAILELHAAPRNVTLEARAAIEAGRYEQAVALLNGRVAVAPGDGEAWHALGLAEVGAGRFDRAIEAWESWGAASPSRAGEAVALQQAARTMLEALRETRE